MLRPSSLLSWMVPVVPWPLKKADVIEAERWLKVDGDWVMVPESVWWREMVRRGEIIEPTWFWRLADIILTIMSLAIMVYFYARMLWFAFDKSGVRAHLKREYQFFRDNKKLILRFWLGELRFYSTLFVTPCFGVLAVLFCFLYEAQVQLSAFVSGTVTTIARPFAFAWEFLRAGFWSKHGKVKKSNAIPLATNCSSDHNEHSVFLDCERNVEDTPTEDNSNNVIDSDGDGGESRFGRGLLASWVLFDFDPNLTGVVSEVVNAAVEPLPPLPPSIIPTASIVRLPQVKNEHLSGVTGGIPPDASVESLSFGAVSDGCKQLLPEQESSLELAVSNLSQIDNVEVTTTPVQEVIEAVTANSACTEAATAEPCSFETESREHLQPSVEEDENGSVSSPAIATVSEEHLALSIADVNFIVDEVGEAVEPSDVLLPQSIQDLEEHVLSDTVVQNDENDLVLPVSVVGEREVVSRPSQGEASASLHVSAGFQTSRESFDQASQSVIVTQWAAELEAVNLFEDFSVADPFLKLDHGQRGATLLDECLHDAVSQVSPQLNAVECEADYFASTGPLFEVETLQQSTSCQESLVDMMAVEKEKQEEEMQFDETMGDVLDLVMDVDEVEVPFMMDVDNEYSSSQFALRPAFVGSNCVHAVEPTYVAAVAPRASPVEIPASSQSMEFTFAFPANVSLSTPLASYTTSEVPSLFVPAEASEAVVSAPTPGSPTPCSDVSSLAPSPLPSHDLFAESSFISAPVQAYPDALNGFGFGASETVDAAGDFALFDWEAQNLAGDDVLDFDLNKEPIPWESSAILEPQGSDRHPAIALTEQGNYDLSGIDLPSDEEGLSSDEDEDDACCVVQGSKELAVSSEEEHCSFQCPSVAAQNAQKKRAHNSDSEELSDADDEDEQSDSDDEDDEEEDNTGSDSDNGYDGFLRRNVDGQVSQTDSQDSDSEEEELEQFGIGYSSSELEDESSEESSSDDEVLSGPVPGVSLRPPSPSILALLNSTPAVLKAATRYLEYLVGRFPGLEPALYPTKDWMECDGVPPTPINTPVSGLESEEESWEDDEDEEDIFAFD